MDHTIALLLFYINLTYSIYSNIKDPVSVTKFSLDSAEIPINFMLKS